MIPTASIDAPAGRQADTKQERHNSGSKGKDVRLWRPAVTHWACHHRRFMHLHCRELALSLSLSQPGELCLGPLARSSTQLSKIQTEMRPQQLWKTGLPISGASCLCLSLLGLDCLFRKGRIPLKTFASCNSYLYIAQLSMPPPLPPRWASKFQASLTC